MVTYPNIPDQVLYHAFRAGRATDSRSVALRQVDLSLACYGRELTADMPCRSAATMRAGGGGPAHQRGWDRVFEQVRRQAVTNHIAVRYPCPLSDCGFSVDLADVSRDSGRVRLIRDTSSCAVRRGGVGDSGVRHLNTLRLDIGPRYGRSGRCPRMAPCAITSMAPIGRSPQAESAPGGCDLVELAARLLLLAWGRPGCLGDIPLRAWIVLTCAGNGTTPTGDGFAAIQPKALSRNWPTTP